MKGHILNRLEQGPATAADLARELQVTLPEVLEQLAALERTGRVVEQFGFYSAVPDRRPLKPNVIIAPEVEDKIRRKHGATPQEVYQAVADPKRRARPVQSEGENPVVKSVGQTFGGRRLCLIIILLPDELYLISARTATQADINDVHYR